MCVHVCVDIYLQMHDIYRCMQVALWSRLHFCICLLVKYTYEYVFIYMRCQIHV